MIKASRGENGAALGQKKYGAITDYFYLFQGREYQARPYRKGANGQKATCDCVRELLGIIATSDDGASGHREQRGLARAKHRNKNSA